MKKHIGKILLILLAVLVAFTLAACDDKTGNNSDKPNGGDDPSPATLSVTFDSNGGIDFGTAYDVEVTYGSTVASPKRADGTAFVPTRIGYTFEYWEDESGEEFIFSDSEEGTPTKVTSDTELSAHWTANTYTHTLVSSADYEDYPYGGNAANGGWTYDGTVTLEDGASFVTVYDSDEATGDIPVPTVQSADGEIDWFVYWYYVTVTEKDGKTVVTEVPFTSWSDEKGTAPELLDDYTIIPESGASGLVLYPKLHSMLPDFNVTYSANGTESTVKAKINDHLTAPETPVRAVFEFDGWFYTVTTGEGDDAVTTEYEFVFYESTEEGDNADKATTLTEKIGIANEDGTYSIALYAKWIRTFTVSDADSLNELGSLVSDALAGDDETAKAEWQNAEITFSDGIVTDIADWTPLFTGKYPFMGTINGNGATVNLTYDADYSGAILALLGANAGDITGLNVSVSVPALGNSSESEILIGAVGVNSGMLNSCNFTLSVGTVSTDAVASDKTLFAGGAAAKTMYGSEISSCTLNVSVYVKANKVYAGGVFGQAISPDNRSTSAIKSTEVALCILHTTATSYAYVGGFGGSAGSVNVTESGVKSADIIVASENAYAGGFSGTTEWSDYSECYTDANIEVTAKYAYAGGFAGSNSALIANCRAESSISVTVRENGEAYAGGIAGVSRRHSTSASHTDSARGDINSSFATGTITVTASGNGATVFAGGIAGRMSSMRSYKSFTSTDITVANNGVSHIGAHTGATVGTVTFDNCYFTDEAELVLNGESVGYTAPSGVKNTPEANFTDTDWLNGESNFNLDRSVWTVVNGEVRLVVETEEESGGEESADEETAASESASQSVAE